MARLGFRQMEQLIKLGSPGTFRLESNAVCDSLIRRGLLKRHGLGSVSITSDGLRALADAMDNGQVTAVLKEMGGWR